MSEETIMRDFARKMVEFAMTNKVAEIGEIVETVWGKWKKPHKVKLYSIGAALATMNSKHSVDVYPVVTYAGLRLDANGNEKDRIGSGIVLSNFTKADGTKWKLPDETINHCGLHFTTPNPEFDKIAKEEKWYRSQWLLEGAEGKEQAK